MNDSMDELLGRLCGAPIGERDFYVESQMILKGLTGLTVEKRHLEAMQDNHECALIKISNMLDEQKKIVLEMP